VVLTDLLGTDIMDRAVREFSECMRRLMLKHSGYEASMDEGTGIMIVAFHR
jgi:hypothetical protein